MCKKKLIRMSKANVLKDQEDTSNKKVNDIYIYINSKKRPHFIQYMNYNQLICLASPFFKTNHFEFSFLQDTEFPPKKA